MIRPFKQQGNRQSGWLVTANHVVMWVPSCRKCGAPTTTMLKVIRESKAQGQNGAKTWLKVIEQGVSLSSGDKICVRCKEDEYVGEGV